MCYNILCDKYCTRQLYGYCPPWALNWDYRKKMILEEVQQYNADIVSLQVGSLWVSLCVAEYTARVVLSDVSKTFKYLYVSCVMLLNGSWIALTAVDAYSYLVSVV